MSSISGWVKRVGGLLLCAVLAGCGIAQRVEDATRIDYQSAPPARKLAWPPDLVAPQSEAAATAGGDDQEAPAYAGAAEHSLTETSNSSSCGCTGSTSVKPGEGMAADSIGSSSSSSSRRQLTEDLVLALGALFQQQLANTSSKQVGGW